MICANCGSENAAGAKFCNECGSTLAAGCPNCGAMNKPGARFCNECGTALAATAGATAGSAGPRPERPVRTPRPWPSAAS